jgi:hypothetical protein
MAQKGGIPLLSAPTEVWEGVPRPECARLRGTGIRGGGATSIKMGGMISRASPLLRDYYEGCHLSGSPPKIFLI